jgi:DnaK suppressor protein
MANKKKKKAGMKAGKKAGKKVGKKAARKGVRKAPARKAPARKVPSRKAPKKARPVARRPAKAAGKRAVKAAGKPARPAPKRAKAAGKAPARSARAAGKKAPPRSRSAAAGIRNAAFFEYFRQRLLGDREQIMRRLGELREELRGIEETPREMEEWAQEEKDRDILIRLEERETDELRKIQAALTLIDTKEYGKCQVCGKPIPRARLEELPTAFRCVDCTP